MIGVLINPVAGKGKPLKYLDKVVSYIKSKGFKSKLVYTKFRGHENEIVEKFIDEGIDKIIIMGGDGTINESLQKLFKHNVAILPLPLGTGDDYIKSVYETSNIYEILSKIGTGRTEKFPVGIVDVESDRFYFINGLGIGFDADVIHNINKIPFLKGHSLYLASIILSIFFFHAMEIRFNIDGLIKKRKKTLVTTIGLGKYLGGGMMMLPKIKSPSNHFDTSIIEEVNKFVFFKMLPLVPKGKHIQSSFVDYIKNVKSVVIESDKFIRFHLDGELMPYKYKKLDVSIVNNGVNIII
jgi:YegS/Rv2252/BmrU family lipid kinase